MIDNKEPITSAEFVTDRLKMNEDIDVTDTKLMQFMKHELGMRYRISKKLPTHANSQKCLVLR